MTQLHIHTVSHGRVTYPPPLDIRYGDLVRLRNTAKRSGMSNIASALTLQIADFMLPQGQSLASQAGYSIQEGLFG